MMEIDENARRCELVQIPMALCEITKGIEEFRNSLGSHSNIEACEGGFQHREGGGIRGTLGKMMRY